MSEEKEDSYSGDSFFDDEPTSSKRFDDSFEKDIVSPPFPADEKANKSDSFVSAKESPSEVSSSPVEGVVKSCMSTIEEESKSYATSTAASSSRQVEHGHVASREDWDAKCSQGLNVDEVIKDLQQFVRETEAESRREPSSAAADANIASNSCNQQEENSTSANDEGIDAILRKLERLESTQNILEDVLDKGVSDNIDINAIIAQIPYGDSVLNPGNDQDLSNRSFSSEIASIQKLIDGGGGDTSTSIHSEVAGGNKLLSLSEGPSSSKRERAVDDVLREYEELERSISQASAIDESFRSDISSVPPLSTYSNKPEDNVPAIKPPVLKSIVNPPFTSANSANTTHTTVTHTQCQMVPPPTRDVYCPPTNKNPSRTQASSSSSALKKTHEVKATSSCRPTRVEGSQSESGMKSKSQQISSYSARPAPPLASSRDQDPSAYKHTNSKRKSMRSPRTMMAQSTEPYRDLPTGTSVGGAGDGYQILKQRQGTSDSNGTEHALTEGVKTIEKLNAMVARQDTLLEAYTQDNQKLWAQVKDAKVESQEKEQQFQDVINSLKTEVATLKLNRLVASSSSTGNSPRQAQANKAELQRLREDSEVKSEQLLELRKQILLLQSRLTEARSPSKQRQSSVQTAISQEREKEYQKSISALNKQVRTLQKILYSKETATPPTQQNTAPQTNGNRFKTLQRTKSDVVRQGGSNANQQTLLKTMKNTGVDALGIYPKRSPNKSITMNTGDILQASLGCLEQEREEFENIIDQKNRLIFEKERVIHQLKDEVETLKHQLPEGEVVEHGLIDELRSRIITQNKVIQTLKEHLSAYKKLEGENVLLREEKNLLEQQVQEYRRKLDFAQNLGKPENEVLSLLSEKVDELNSRYHHRERQLDTLLNRLSLKTTTGGCGASVSSTNLSPLRLTLDQFTNNNGTLGGPLARGGRSAAFISSDILNIADLSPSASFQLFNTVSDLPEM